MVYFYVLCYKDILKKIVGYQQPTCLCVKMEFVMGTILFSCELCSLSKVAFFHVGPVQLCTENCVSIFMCSAVEVVLQPLRWCCVDGFIHHEREVREEQHHTYMWREQAIIE